MNSPWSNFSTPAALALITLITGYSQVLQAQEASIERTKATDGALSCGQIFAESADMDKVVAQASAAETDGNTTAVAGAAGKVGAEVAERTGLFGRIGGIGGALFGKLAANTAAGAAQESGSTAAQQAAQRAKQAAGRKDALTMLAQSKRCDPSDPSANPVADPAGSAALPVATPVAVAAPVLLDATNISLPDLNPAEWFDGKTGGTFGEKTVNAFTRNNRVAIAGFRVVFVTHNETSAITRGSYMPGGRETGTAKAKMEVDLQGVDDATLQALTNAAYQRFIGQLKATGREVVPVDQFKPAYADFKTAPVPQEVNTGPLRGRAFSPTDLPLWWQVGDAWGDSGLSQTNMRAFNELSKASNAIAIAPGIVIDFARMQSSGNSSGYGSSTAEVGAKLSMSVSTFTTRVVRAEETRYGGIVFKGDDGMLQMLHRIDTEAQFADLQKVEENDKGSVMSLFGALGAKSKQSVNLAKTSNATYSAAANAVLAQATGTFSKLLVTNPVAK